MRVRWLLELDDDLHELFVAEERKSGIPVEQQIRRALYENMGREYPPVDDDGESVAEVRYLDLRTK